MSSLRKWLYGTAGAIGTAIAVGMANDAHDWVKRCNSDHDILQQLVWKNEFLYGKIPQAPVDWPKK